MWIVGTLSGKLEGVFCLKSTQQVKQGLICRANFKHRADPTSRRALVPTQLAPPWPQCPHPAFFSMRGPGQRPDLAIESFQRAIERDQSVTSP
jgi:hypothetical protein